MGLNLDKVIREKMATTLAKEILKKLNPNAGAPRFIVRIPIKGVKRKGTALTCITDGFSFTADQCCFLEVEFIAGDEVIYKHNVGALSTGMSFNQPTNSGFTSEQ